MGRLQEAKVTSLNSFTLTCCSIIPLFQNFPQLLRTIHAHIAIFSITQIAQIKSNSGSWKHRKNKKGKRKISKQIINCFPPKGKCERFKNKWLFTPVVPAGIKPTKLTYILWSILQGNTERNAEELDLNVGVQFRLCRHTLLYKQILSEGVNKKAWSNFSKWKAT